MRVKPNSHVAIVACMYEQDEDEIEAQVRAFSRLVAEVIATPTITKVTLIKADTLQRYSGSHLKELAVQLTQAKCAVRTTLATTEEKISALAKRVEQKPYQHMQGQLRKANDLIAQVKVNVLAIISDLPAMLRNIKGVPSLITDYAVEYSAEEKSGHKDLLCAITLLFEIESEISAQEVGRKWSQQNRAAVIKLKKAKSVEEKSWNDFRLNQHFNRRREEIEVEYGKKKEFAKRTNANTDNFYNLYGLALYVGNDEEVKTLLLNYLTNYIKEESAFLKLVCADEKESYHYEICLKKRNSAMEYIYRNFCERSERMKPISLPANLTPRHAPIELQATQVNPIATYAEWSESKGAHSDSPLSTKYALEAKDNSVSLTDLVERTLVAVAHSNSQVLSDPVKAENYGKLLAAFYTTAKRLSPPLSPNLSPQRLPDSRLRSTGVAKDEQQQSKAASAVLAEQYQRDGFLNTSAQTSSSAGSTLSNENDVMVDTVAVIPGQQLS
jgi:hypothetical protein